MYDVPFCRVGGAGGADLFRCGGATNGRGLATDLRGTERMEVLAVVIVLGALAADRFMARI